VVKAARVLTEAMATATSSFPKRLCQGHLISNLMQKNMPIVVSANAEAIVAYAP
jgi:hypothetical protein